MRICSPVSPRCGEGPGIPDERPAYAGYREIEVSFAPPAISMLAVAVVATKMLNFI